MRFGHRQLLEFGRRNGAEHLVLRVYFSQLVSELLDLLFRLNFGLLDAQLTMPQLADLILNEVEFFLAANQLALLNHVVLDYVEPL